MGLPGDSYSSGVAGGGFGGGLHPAYAAGMIANGVGLGEYIQRAASAVPKHTPLDMIVTHGTATARRALLLDCRGLRRVVSEHSASEETWRLVCLRRVLECE
jgi:hypothetical protein